MRDKGKIIILLVNIGRKAPLYKAIPSPAKELIQMATEKICPIAGEARDKKKII
jgi:hypothetical protein